MALWWLGANMKPKPTDSMHSATAPGARSIRAPAASSTSAEPHLLVAERLPCLATRQPAPAATNAAVVETLKVGGPPPVPAVSTRSAPSTSTGVASSRMVRASPVISSTVSPLARRAISSAAAWASEALPSITSRSTRAAESAVRSSPSARRSIASVRGGLGIQEVAEQALAVLGQDRLRVELHALGGQVAVAERHHRAIRLRRALEAVGQARAHHQRVVAPGHEG